MPATSELDPPAISVALGRDPKASLESQRQAFVQLYKHYQKRVRYSVARAAMNAACRQRSDDLCQEVWCRFARPLGGVLRYFDATRGAFGPFITRVAYQQAMDIIRRDRRRKLNVAPVDTFEDDIEDPKTAALFATLVQLDFYNKLIDRATRELDADDYMLLREIYLHERNCQVVAREQDINKNTIYKRHQRLKKKLGDWADELLQMHAPADRQLQNPTVAMVLALMLTSLSAPSLDDSLPISLDSFPSSEDPEA